MARPLQRLGNPTSVGLASASGTRGRTHGDSEKDASAALAEFPLTQTSPTKCISELPAGLRRVNFIAGLHLAQPEARGAGRSRCMDASPILAHEMRCDVCGYPRR